MNPTPWHQLNAEAVHHREELWRHVREWAAMHHATTRCRELPGRVVAALDATGQPARTKLVALHDHTPREAAEAGADDLWDAAAVVWAAVKHVRGNGTPHVVAELVRAGQWLARFPAHAGVHDRALAELFANTTEVVA
jgi:hypothetical protein